MIIAMLKIRQELDLKLIVDMTSALDMCSFEEALV